MSQIKAFWEECLVEYRLEQTSRTPEVDQVLAGSEIGQNLL